MAQQFTDLSTLYASSIEELLSHEAEILKRINAMPNLVATGSGPVTVQAPPARLKFSIMCSGCRTTATR